MRNLKRALSLGLTAAMISGLMVMGSSAVSYNDSESIQNQTAVEILLSPFRIRPLWRFSARLGPWSAMTRATSIPTRM